MDRREFMKLLSGTTLSGASYIACTNYMQEALAQSTAVEDLQNASPWGKKGSLAEIEHVIFLMQENRSFDHYFGTLRGVRGFGDPRPLALKSGASVWQQPQDGGDPPAQPFHIMQGQEPSGQIQIYDPAHDHGTGLQAWNHGLMDQWVAAKQVGCMVHYKDADHPLYTKLAKAFTICDANFCSVNGPTAPNRSYFFTGTSLGMAAGGDSPAPDEQKSVPVNWRTYAERLQALKVNWKFYQDGLGDHGGTTSLQNNYGDNTLTYFDQFQPGSANFVGNDAYRRNQTANTILRTDANTPSQFEQDIANNQLPQVSWIVAPYAFCEHPNAPPYFGEFYVNEILRALAQHPSVWQKTVLIINYDENGGFFDHIPSPAPPVSGFWGVASPSINIQAGNASQQFNFNTEDSYGSSQPIGLGARVPLLVISPWSVGGRVCSEIFDHTSSIRFVERWLSAKGIINKSTPAFPNISSWRQNITGDLTATLDFDHSPGTTDLQKLASPPKDAVVLTQSQIGAVLGTPQYTPTAANAAVEANVIVATKQDRARAELLPIDYDFAVLFKPSNASNGTRAFFNFSNAGKLGVPLIVYAYHRKDGPWHYSVAAATGHNSPSIVTDTFLPANGNYHYVAHSANGYLAEFGGDDTSATQRLLPEIVAVDSSREAEHVHLRFDVWPSANGAFTMIDAYTGDQRRVEAGAESVKVKTIDGWYDVALIDASATSTYVRRYAGHVENGKISRTDPAIGKIYDATHRVYLESGQTAPAVQNNGVRVI